MTVVALVACHRDPRSRIVGKWQEIGGPEKNEFFPDGTITAQSKSFGVPESLAGNYKFIDGTHMRIELGGLGALAGPLVYDVGFEGEMLVLTDQSGKASRYQRYSASAASPPPPAPTTSVVASTPKAPPDGNRGNQTRPPESGGPYGVDEHTVGLWRFEEASGSVVADSTGKNPGQAVGTSITRSLWGNARSFRGNGQEDFLVVPNSSSLAGLAQITIEAWILPTSFDLGQWNAGTRIVSKGDGTNPANLFGLGIDRNAEAGGGASRFTSFTVTMTIANRGRSADATSSQHHPPGKWYYVAGTYDGEKARVYLDGVLEAESGAQRGIVVTTEDPLFINNHTWGNRDFHSGARLGGLIDEVRISNVARSQDDIRATASRGVPAKAEVPTSPLDDREALRSTMADMRSIATACEAFAVDHNRYPDAKSIDTLVPSIVPTYIRVCPQTDGWRHDFEYHVSPDGQNYRIISGGADGRVEPGSRQTGSPTKGATASSSADIIFENGQFAQYPQAAAK